MDNKETVKRVEERLKQDETKRNEEERKKNEAILESLAKKRWEETHWKEAAWGSEYQKSERWEYAIWYYNERFKLIKTALLPFLSSLVAFIYFWIHPKFEYYLLSGLFIGIARSIFTVGFERGQGPQKKYSQYKFYNKDNSSRLGTRVTAFIGGVIFAPLLIPYSLYDFSEVIKNRNNPVPYYIEKDDDHDSSDWGTSETYVGRIDENGKIYKRD